METALTSSSDDDSRPASIGGLGLLLARENAPLINPQAMLSFTSREQWSPVMAPESLLLAGNSDTDSEDPPFLQDRIGANEVEYYIGSGNKFTTAHLAKEVRKQAWLSAPLAADLVMTHGLTLVSLAWAAQLGTLPLAVAALGAASYTMLGRLSISGICGALDTQAAQAFGGGDVEALPAITQRAVLFSLLHCVPITALLVAGPSIMKCLGVEPVLCTLVFPYICILVPRLWIEALNRPLYGCLLAQRIALPQMCITAVVITFHVYLCYALIFQLELGLSGAALGTTISSSVNFILTLVFVLSRGLQARTWGRPTAAALKGWRRFARLAYASCAMKVLEAWSAGVTILLAALLPAPEQSVASITVASDLYSVLSMPFLAGGMAACVRVGAALGAGQAAGAQLAARASLLAVPALWLLLAALLLEPHSQSLVLWLFTKGDDVELMARLRGLLQLDVIMVLLTGLQAICAGIIGGTAKQAKGALVNFVSFWCVGLPLGAFLAFRSPGRGWGVEGLLGGLLLGPLIQTCCYAVIVMRISWKNEAFSAWSRVSLGG